ncbi:MAG: glycosyltransferase [bacterium]|nr:glycosyltransferase [bacterium]
MILSIIIPAKNEEKQLPVLLASIKNQTFKDLEIIVADAKSTDKTREVVASLGGRVVEGGMPGPGRNRGAEAALGEILLFLDADVILVGDDFLEKTVAEFKVKKLCCAAPLSRTSSDIFLDRLYPKLWNIWIMIASHFSPCAGGWCIFATKAAHDKIKGFDEKIILGEDSDYSYRASRICKFGILKSAVVENSPRRLHKEGYLKVFLQVVGAGFNRFIMGRRDYQNKFNYKFDIYDKKDDKK